MILYGIKNNISTKETTGLENFYTKAMMKKLRKTNNDCGFLNGSFSNMLKKVSNYTNLKDGKRKEYVEFKEKFDSEMSLRPETPCEKIKNKTKDLSKDAEELDKKIKDVRGELDRARLTKVLDQLYQQAVDYRRLMGILELVKKASVSKDYKEVASLIGAEIKLSVTEEQMDKVMAGSLKAKIEGAELDTVDRVFDDVKEFIKTLQADAKNEL